MFYKGQHVEAIYRHQIDVIINKVLSWRETEDGTQY